MCSSAARVKEFVSRVPRCTYAASRHLIWCGLALADFPRRRFAVTWLDRLRWSSLFVCWNRRGGLRRNSARVGVLGGISWGAPDGAGKIRIRLAT